MRRINHTLGSPSGLTAGNRSQRTYSSAILREGRSHSVAHTHGKTAASIRRTSWGTGLPLPDSRRNSLPSLCWDRNIWVSIVQPIQAFRQSRQFVLCVLRIVLRPNIPLEPTHRLHRTPVSVTGKHTHTNHIIISVRYVSHRRSQVTVGVPRDSIWVKTTAKGWIALHKHLKCLGGIDPPEPLTIHVVRY